MRAEILYSGPLRKLGFRFSGPPWVFIVVLALAILLLKALW
jgi:hypothetical protein